MKSIPASRVVAVLTPVLAAGSAVGTAWLSKHFPGLPKFSPTEVTALAVAGAGSVVGPAVKWLDGNSKFERDTLTLSHEAAQLDKSLTHEAAQADKVDPGIAEKVEAFVKAEVAKLAPKVIEEVGAPASAWPDVEHVADEVTAAAEQPASPAQTVEVIPPAVPVQAAPATVAAA